jgi:hypothetical protein
MTAVLQRLQQKLVYHTPKLFQTIPNRCPAKGITSKRHTRHLSLCTYIGTLYVSGQDHAPASSGMYMDLQALLMANKLAMTAASTSEGGAQPWKPSKA